MSLMYITASLVTEGVGAISVDPEEGCACVVVVTFFCVLRTELCSFFNSCAIKMALTVCLVLLQCC